MIVSVGHRSTRSVRGRRETGRSRRILGALIAATLLGSGCRSGGYTPIHTHFNKGVEHQFDGRFEEAIAEYRLALADDPDDYRSRFNLATAYESRALELRRAGRAEEAGEALAAAEAEYRRVIASKPNDLRASINLAAILYESGEREPAKAMLREVIAADANDDEPLPRVALAAHLFHEGRTEEAVALLREAKEIEPTDVGTNMLLGDGLARLGDTDEAREAYRAALERKPTDEATLLALARLELATGRADEARVCLMQLLLIDPRHYEAHVTCADLNEHSGRYEEAAQHLWCARAIEEEEGLPPAWDGPQVDYSARLVEIYRRLTEIETSEGAGRPAAPRTAEQ